MTDANKMMNPQHPGSDPAEIRIRINPEIWIWIPPDHFWLLSDALAEVCRLRSWLHHFLYPIVS